MDLARPAGFFHFWEATIPSKSPAQARLMAAAAHTRGGYGGVPQKVGKEFNSADTGTGILSRAMKKPKKMKIIK